METKEAISTMGQYSRMSIIPKLAKEIASAFGLKLDDELIYTNKRYRETSNGKPRVAIYELAEWICKQLKLKPDENKIKESNIYCGEGRRVECIVDAYLAPLIEKFG